MDSNQGSLVLEEIVRPIVPRPLSWWEKVIVSKNMKDRTEQKVPEFGKDQKGKIFTLISTHQNRALITGSISYG